jgi:predicted nucleic acid-binding protein
MFSNDQMLMNYNYSLIGIDTNILVYFLNSESVYHEKAKTFIESLTSKRISGVITWQNLSEMYAVVTDGKRFPRPMTASQAVNVIESLLENENIKLVLPVTDTKKTFLNSLLGIKPKGQKVHDVFLAATFLSNGVTTLITQNTKDFLGIKSLKVTALSD